VQLLQPNVAQDEKFAAERMPATLQWVASRLIASRADLVVAPETAVPLLPADLEGFAPGYWQALQQRFAQGSQAALVGVPLGDFERGYTNSVAGLSAAGAALPLRQAAPGAVRRVHPLRVSLVHRAHAHPAGRLRRGALAQPSFERCSGERAAPNICYGLPGDPGADIALPLLQEALATGRQVAHQARRAHGQARPGRSG
jgi:apolipoprotein N-acyltransferase